MSLTPLEKELLAYVKALSEACEQSVNTSDSQFQSLSVSVELLMASQSEVFNALDALASEEIEFKKLTESLQTATRQLLDAQKKIAELSQK